MFAIVRHRFGGPEVLELVESPMPEPAADEVLVDVRATSVTSAEWRFRAKAFPAGMGLAGSLMLGFSAPRDPRTGRDFAGRVIAVGANVTGFRVGDDVFGAVHGANADVIAVKASGAIAPMPEGLSYEEAAALPFGAITALTFVREWAGVQAGERVLVVGASGGVGTYVVQVAAQLGAQVTAVCSASHAAYVRELGATEVIDYRTQDALAGDAVYDVVIDVVGKTTVGTARRVLRPDGRHVVIDGSLETQLRGLVDRVLPGPRVITGVSMDDRKGLDAVSDAVAAGLLRPVVGARFEHTDVVDAHRLLDTRHRSGAIILGFPEA